MIIFNKIKYKNILSTGNKFNEIDLDVAKTSLCIGKNGEGKCVYINTPIKVRNIKTGEIISTTIGEFYELQEKQIKQRKD
jgi:ABC-type branched-subunit amino acid transport system ATPase component